MSRRYKKYLKLRENLKKARQNLDYKQEEKILQRLEYVWWKMTPEERMLILETK